MILYNKPLKILRDNFSKTLKETPFLQLDRLRNGEGRGKVERTLSFNFN